MFLPSLLLSLLLLAFLATGLVALLTLPRPGMPHLKNAQTPCSGVPSPGTSPAQATPAPQPQPRRTRRSHQRHRHQRHPSLLSCTIVGLPLAPGEPSEPAVRQLLRQLLPGWPIPPRLPTTMPSSTPGGRSRVVIGLSPDLLEAVRRAKPALAHTDPGISIYMGTPLGAYNPTQRPAHPPLPQPRHSRVGCPVGGVPPPFERGEPPSASVASTPLAPTSDPVVAPYLAQQLPGALAQQPPALATVQQQPAAPTPVQQIAAGALPGVDCSLVETEQPMHSAPSVGSLLLVWLVYLISMAIAIALAMLAGTLFSQVDVAAAVLPTYTSTLLYFSGFLIPWDQMPNYWRWYSVINYMRYSWGALVVNQFEGPNNIPAYGDQTVLDYYGLNVNKWAWVGYCSLFLVAILALAWAALVGIRHQKR